MWDTWICGQLCGERRHVRERWPASEWNGGSIFCRGTARGGHQSPWVKYDIFKLVGQGVCQRRLTEYKKIAHAREYREAHPKKN